MNNTSLLNTNPDSLVELRDIRFGYGERVILDGISLTIPRGTVTALMGASGGGKTTVLRLIGGQYRAQSGGLTFDGEDAHAAFKSNDAKAMRKRIQMIFQDPISSLDPRMTVQQLIDEPLEIWGRGTREERDERIKTLLNNVGLEPELVLNRRSYEFSGGQCQRISIARALALDPRMLICDEPVSALDVSIQAQILNLLQDMKDQFGLTMVFISHDLAVVKAVSDRVMVMYLGKICEIAAPDALYSKPAHHYTKALLDSVPIADPTRQRKTELLQGEPPSPMNPPTGCRFRTRCAAATLLCAEQEPQLREVSPGQFVACHHPIV